MLAAKLRRCGAPGAGFTLVEVLVALVIMALIAAMGWQGVSGMARARDAAQAYGERTLRLSTLVAQWEQDLLALYDGPLVPALSFDGAALRLTRRAASGTQSGVQVVVWSLRDGRWRRWASAPATRNGELQQAWTAALQLQGAEPGQLLLVEGVTDWQVYFWRGGGWSNAQSSGDLNGEGAPAGAQNPATERIRLPAGVRLTIDLPEGRLQRDLALAPQAS